MNLIQWYFLFWAAECSWPRSRTPKGELYIFYFAREPHYAVEYHQVFLQKKLPWLIAHTGSTRREAFINPTLVRSAWCSGKCVRWKLNQPFSLAKMHWVALSTCDAMCSPASPLHGVPAWHSAASTSYNPNWNEGKQQHWRGPCMHCSPARDNVLYVLPSKQRSRPPFIFHNLYQTWPKCSGKVRPLSQRPCCLERERRDALISRAQNKTAEMRRVNITKISFIFQKSIFSKHYRIKNIYRFYILSLDWLSKLLWACGIIQMVQ